MAFGFNRPAAPPQIGPQNNAPVPHSRTPVPHDNSPTVRSAGVNCCNRNNRLKTTRANGEFDRCEVIPECPAIKMEASPFASPDAVSMDRPFVFESNSKIESGGSRSAYGKHDKQAEIADGESLSLPSVNETERWPGRAD